MNKELQDLIKSLNNNDRRLDGEDGGAAISTLAEHLMPVGIINAGRVDYSVDGYCNLLIKVYDYHGWKFVVQEDQDVHPVYDGGTVYTGTVDLYNITSKAV